MDADLVSKPISQIPGEAPAIGPTPASDDAHFPASSLHPWKVRPAAVIQRLVIRFRITQSHQAVAALKKQKIKISLRI